MKPAKVLEGMAAGAAGEGKAKAAEALRGKLLGKEQAALFRRHRRSQGRRRQPQEAVSKETPGG